MKLTGNDGCGLDVEIVGYQFPELSDRDDGNWLRVVGRIEHPRGDWTFEDPCLTTVELEQLAAWFEGVVTGTPDPDSGYFTEPNLEFTWTPSPEPSIMVKLAYESSPPWLVDRNARLEGVMLRFPLSLNDPRAASSALRDALRRYPTRGLPEVAG